MKFNSSVPKGKIYASCPARGTWIEMVTSTTRRSYPATSCPARGTWIEIASPMLTFRGYTVVPRKGHVD